MYIMHFDLVVVSNKIVRFGSDKGNWFSSNDGSWRKKIK
jgi:hypothetical protein